MKIYDAKCPICGAVNHNLYLEDSGEFMECKQCRRIVKVVPMTKEMVGVIASDNEKSIAVNKACN